MLISGSTYYQRGIQYSDSLDQRPHAARSQDGAECDGPDDNKVQFWAAGWLVLVQRRLLPLGMRSGSQFHLSRPLRGLVSMLDRGSGVLGAGEM